MGGLNPASGPTYGTRKGSDPLKVSRIANWLHFQLLLNEWRPIAKQIPGISAPPSIAALIDRLSTLTSGLFTWLSIEARRSMSSQSSNRSHVAAGNFSVSILYSEGITDSSTTSTDGGQARTLRVVVFPSSLRYLPLLSVPRCSMVSMT